MLTWVVSGFSPIQRSLRYAAYGISKKFLMVADFEPARLQMTVDEFGLH